MIKRKNPAMENWMPWALLFTLPVAGYMFLSMTRVPDTIEDTANKLSLEALQKKIADMHNELSIYERVYNQRKSGL